MNCSFPYRHKEPELYSSKIASYYKFHVEGCDTALGWLLPSTVEKIEWSGFWEIDHNSKIVLLKGSSVAERDARMEQTLLSSKERRAFKVLEDWQDERFPVYGPGKILFLSIERVGCGLFGVTTYGVHMNAYVVEDGKIKYWVAERSAKRRNNPGKLDNTVGGGMTTGEEPRGEIAREALEEAAFPKAVVLENVKSAGVVTYLGIRKNGLLKPDCVYVYDLLLPPDIIPKPGCDKEVERFELMDVEQVQAALVANKFKPNCALVIVDFFIRHGIITAENEKDYIEISARLHRNPEFPTASFERRSDSNSD